MGIVTADEGPPVAGGVAGVGDEGDDEEPFPQAAVRMRAAARAAKRTERMRIS